jgi:hypothetical protein
MNPEMRASDADRDRVVDVLRAAVTDGRLTAEEFDGRVEGALSARTFGELAVLTADLGRPSGGPDPMDLAAAKADEVIRIDQRGGSVKRAGPWVVPRRMELRPSWCDVTLDFTDAVITHDTLLIDMNMRGGSLALVAGPGVVVDADSLAVKYTDIEIGPSIAPGAPVVLRVRLTGRMRYGWVGTRRVQADPDELPSRCDGGHGRRCCCPTPRSCSSGPAEGPAASCCWRRCAATAWTGPRSGSRSSPGRPGSCWAGSAPAR